MTRAELLRSAMIRLSREDSDEAYDAMESEIQRALDRERADAIEECIAAWWPAYKAGFGSRTNVDTGDLWGAVTRELRKLKRNPAEVTPRDVALNEAIAAVRAIWQDAQDSSWDLGFEEMRARAIQAISSLKYAEAEAAVRSATTQRRKG